MKFSNGNLLLCILLRPVSARRKRAWLLVCRSAASPIRKELCHDT